MMTGKGSCVAGWTVTALMLGAGLLIPSAHGFAEWETYKDDDGSMDSRWGMCGAPNEILRKTVVLEKAAGAQDAIVQYQMAGNPYHYATKTYPNKPKEGVTWNRVMVRVNGSVVACGSPIEVATIGWHKIRFDPKLLKPGENHIDFTWAEKGTVEGRGVFYLGIDTGTHKKRSSLSSNRGKTFSVETLRGTGARPDPRWQGEYMVRLQVAWPGEKTSTFVDNFDRSDVMGPNWVATSGRWDVRPGNLKGNGPGAVMMCTRRLQTPLRIEYECYSDRPCDLSIVLNKSLDKRPVCFVGFGAENNTLNKIETPTGGRLAASKDRLIDVGRKHKVVVAVGNDGTITQTIDGQQTLKATVRMLPKRLFFGFYVWEEGVFNGVRVFSAPTKPAATSPVEGRIPLVRRFRSFNASTHGPIADKAAVVRAAENCSAKIVDSPTWEYFYRQSRPIYKPENRDPAIPEPPANKAANKGARFVPDPCLELRDANAAPDKQARVTFPVPQMKKGFIEFDVMADHYAGNGLRVGLGDKVALCTDKDGTYHWQTGTRTVKLLDRLKTYPSIRGETRFYLQPQRWFTVRISFDLYASLANVAMVEMFNGTKCRQTEYLLVGEDLSLPMDTINQVTFKTRGTGRFLVDNLFMISRTADLADDAKWQAPARTMMTAYYPLRKDPIHLKTWSMRHIRFMEGSGTPAGDEVLHKDLWKYTDILNCAEKYNRIMIRQALLGEQMKGLERAWFYAKTARGDYAARVGEARKAAQKTADLLAELYEFYAACYLDHLNQARLKAGFGRRYDALDAALTRAEGLLRTTLADMRATVIKRTKCRFAPYAIEPVTSRSMTLKFSDGAFRRPDGKRDFLFPRTRRFLWPSMESILMFSPTAPINVDSHVIRGTQKPAYCNASTDTYFYSCMTARRPNDHVALRLNYGQHNHESSLPEWWLADHKADPDIFLQNSRGGTYVSPTQIAKQYNYWNPTVLAAHKATMEALGAWVLKHGWGDRVDYIDMAQEAYFQIVVAGAGGAWETGYNPTAVKAFRKRLKAKYQRVGSLNKRWGSRYAGFDNIRPPADWGQKPQRVPGLTCAFERFRQHSWSAWLKQCHAWLKGKLGRDVPNSCQITYNGETCVGGLDWVKLFDTFNIVMEHYSQQFESKPILYRYLENLRQVFQSSTGIGEWYVSGLGDIFDEENIRNNGLRQTYQQVQWGRSVLVYWQGHDFMFLHNGNATENRLGHTVLRYHAAYIPVGITRAAMHRAIYLECPLVQPDVGIIDSESSFYNVWPVRGGWREFADLLHRHSHDFGFLFERFIMDGRQPLDPYRVLVLPRAGSLPNGFVGKLLEWVKAGGMLVTTGPVGVTDELGVPSGRFLNEVIGQGQWTYANGKLRVKVKPNGAQVVAVDSYKQPALLQRQHGKGKVLIRVNPTNENTMYEQIRRRAPRRFYQKGNRFHLAMRDGAAAPPPEKGCLYLSVLNPSCHERLEDEIVLAGQYGQIVDISNNFPIVPKVKDGKTAFKLSLMPAEGIVVRIRQ